MNSSSRLRPINKVIDTINMLNAEYFRDYYPTLDLSEENQYEIVLSRVLNNLFEVGKKKEKSEEIYQFSLNALSVMQEKSPRAFEDVNWDFVLKWLYNVPGDKSNQRFATLLYHRDDQGNPDQRVCMFATLKRMFPDFDINAMQTKAGVGVLAMACMSASDDKHLKTLLDLGADIHALSEQHGKPLHFIHPGSSFAIQKLRVMLQNGANPMENIKHYHPWDSLDDAKPTNDSFYDFLVKQCVDAKHTSMESVYQNMLDLLMPFRSMHAADEALKIHSNAVKTRKITSI